MRVVRLLYSKCRNGGGAFDSWNNNTGDLTAFTVLFNGAVAAGGTPRNLGVRHEGGFGGGQIGYNWQRSQFVFGVEADIQGADIGRTNTIIFPAAAALSRRLPTGAITPTGSARRAPGSVSRPSTALFYVTGGAAFGEVNSSVSNVYNPNVAGNFFGTNNDTRFGWAVGAGIEWTFAPHWSVKGEYLHVDLGSSDVVILDPVNFPGSSAVYHFRHQFDTARIGLNYRFGAGAVVAKY